MNANLQPSAPLLRVEQVSKAYGRTPRAFTAISDVNLDIRPGEFVCLLGPSGCGKSTLARALLDHILEEGDRTVTSLDGDVVRLAADVSGKVSVLQ